MSDERRCLCGCGRSLEGRDPKAQYARPCVELREKARRKTKDARYKDKVRHSKHSKLVESQRKSLDNGAHHVVGRRDPSDPVRDARKMCPVCLDMSWIRVGVCVGCDKAFELEPRPEGLSPMQSNMGSLISEGRLYGYSGVGGGHHGKKA